MWNFSLASQDFSTIGFVYQWTNNITSKKYIGSHNGSNKTYLSSGIAINYAFKKYGLKNFSRTILYVGSYYREVEQEILQSLDVMHSPNFYNMTNYALGGSLPGSDSPMFGKTHSLETREKMRLAALGRSRPMSDIAKCRLGNSIRGTNHYLYGKTIPETTKEALRKANKGKVPANKGIPHSEETKQLSAIAGKKGSGIGNHNRWHRNRNIKKEGCEFC